MEDNEEMRNRRMDEIEELARTIEDCRQCPRLVDWREQVANDRVRRFRDHVYWGRPLAGFGDPAARIMIVGLAPAAHGGNRTGRMFTGDDSATWLAEALHRVGLANQPHSDHRDDGYRLIDSWITAAVRCAPPKNRPSPVEIRQCSPYLHQELRLINPRVVIALGKIAFDAVGRYLRSTEKVLPKWHFAHGKCYDVSPSMTVIGSYHPSRQNTQTKRLTRDMFDNIFDMAVSIASDRS